MYLTHLDLRQNMIGSEGAKAIAHCVLAGGFKRLTHLYLMNNQIQDQGLTALYKSFTSEEIMCPEIECVNVRDNPFSPKLRKSLRPCPVFIQL